MQEFKDIVGWPGYRVSNDGVVESCRTKAGTCSSIWRTVAVSKTRDGYLQVHLWNRRKNKLRRIHTLVLEAFVGPPPPNHQVCHENNNRGDNRLENLRWGTIQDNIRDREATGNTARGERGNSKLTTADVCRIRKMRGQGVVFQAIANSLNVSKRQVMRICKKESWAHVPEQMTDDEIAGAIEMETDL